MFIMDVDYVFLFNIYTYFCQNKFVLLLKNGKNDLDKRNNQNYEQAAHIFTVFHVHE